MNTTDNMNVQTLILCLIGSIAVCMVAFFIIKIASNVTVKTGKIAYWRYVIPLFLAGCIYFFQENIKQYTGLNISSTTICLISLLIAIIVFILLIIKFGIIRGLCMFIIQAVAAVLLACLIYAGMALIAMAIAGVMGIAMTSSSGIWLISYEDDEKVYVSTKNDYYIDQDGRIYMTLGETVIRQDDSKIFYFVD